MLTFTQRIAHPSQLLPPNSLTLSLSADERTRSRHYFESDQGQPLYLRLPRGTILHHGDWLQTETGEGLQIIARAEPVLTVTSPEPLMLLRAAYHLGNRHVALEVTEAYLRLAPDPVLQAMLEQMLVQVVAGCHPFQPEAGAYHSHANSHANSHASSHASSHVTHRHGEHEHHHGEHEHHDGVEP
jgi:urease accessory protein